MWQRSWERDAGEDAFPTSDHSLAFHCDRAYRTAKGDILDTGEPKNRLWGQTSTIVVSVRLAEQSVAHSGC